MAFFTVISIVLAMFGASQAIMSAIRTHSEASLKVTVDEAKQLSSEFIARCNKTAEIKDTMTGYSKAVEKAFKTWRVALFSPTVLFAGMVVLLFLAVECFPWTDGTGDVIKTPSKCIWYTKILLFVYFILLATANIVLFTTKNAIRNLYKQIVQMNASQISGQSDNQIVPA